MEINLHTCNQLIQKLQQHQDLYYYKPIHFQELLLLFQTLLQEESHYK